MSHETHEQGGGPQTGELDPDESRRSSPRGRSGDDGNDGYDDDDLDEGDDSEGRGRAFLRNIWGGIKEIIIIAVMAMVLSFVVKTWLIQAFYIPSGSMENTLMVDDRVIVSKLTPGPVDLSRGDIVVFQDPDHWLGNLPAAPPEPGVRGAIHRGLQFVGLLPDDSDDHLIKRVIGLPGDHVVCCGKDGGLTINGVEITENYIKPGDTPGGGKQPFDIVVPAGRVWVMGDHRSDSSDSRFHDDGTGATGSVPIADITGRAVTIVWPVDHVDWLSVPGNVYGSVPAPKSTPKATTTTKPTTKPATTATTTAP
jgi:signal peptidase I